MLHWKHATCAAQICEHSGVEHRYGPLTLLAGVSGVVAWFIPIPDRSPYASAAAYSGLIYLVFSALNLATTSSPFHDDALVVRLVGFAAICTLASPASSWMGSLGPALGATLVLWALVWGLSCWMTARRKQISTGNRTGPTAFE